MKTCGKTLKLHLCGLKKVPIELRGSALRRNKGLFPQECLEEETLALSQRTIFLVPLYTWHYIFILIRNDWNMMSYSKTIWNEHLATTWDANLCIFECLCASFNFIQKGNENPAQPALRTNDKCRDSAIWCAMGFVGGISSIRIPSNGYINHMMTIPILQVCAMAARQHWRTFYNESAWKPRELASSSFKQATLAGRCWTTWLSLCYLLFECLEVNGMWTCTQHKWET